MITKVLMVGCGDVGIRLASQLPRATYSCIGLRRHPQHLPSFIQPFAADLNALPALPPDLDYVVITLVPAERSDAGYRAAYVDNLQTVIDRLQAQATPPRRVFLVSSTSVYGQADGEWVDEDSETSPAQYSGKRVLEGEERLLASGLAATIVRFSGIYGPGRLRVIKQVQAGDHGEADEGISNRIHVEDCAGTLAHLIQLDQQGENLAPCYLASDCEPVLLATVKQWLAAQMGLAATTSVANASGSMVRGNKRCCNQRLLESGYQFRYPSFRDGYSEMLAAEGLLKNGFVKSPALKSP